MAYLAILNFEGEEFDVIRCECGIERESDSKGRPSSNLYGGKVFIEVESTGDTTIFEHMATQFKPNKGTVTFNKDEADVMKEWKWENGFITDMNEGKRSTDGTPMSIRFAVSVQTLIVGGIELKQNWPEAG
jgi:hypothetical protein